VLSGVAVILAVTLAWPVTAALFRFGPLPADDLAVTAGAGLAVLVALELLKRCWAARLKGDPYADDSARRNLAARRGLPP
jgi:Ca2+-transporting ATPase